MSSRPRRALLITPVLLLATVAVTGCGDSSDAAGTTPSPAVTSPPPATASASPSATPTPMPTPTPSPTSNGVQIVEVTVTDGTVKTASDRVAVALGKTVRLVVTSDKADELHVHGYDEEAELAPGTPSTLEFLADEPGLFDVETHDGHQLLVQLAVQ